MNTKEQPCQCGCCEKVFNEDSSGCMALRLSCIILFTPLTRDDTNRPGNKSEQKHFSMLVGHNCVKWMDGWKSGKRHTQKTERWM